MLYLRCTNTELMDKLVQLWTKCKELIPLDDAASMGSQNDCPNDCTDQYIDQVIWTALNPSN